MALGYSSSRAIRPAAKRPTITIHIQPDHVFHLTCRFCKPPKHQSTARPFQSCSLLWHILYGKNMSASARYVPIDGKSAESCHQIGCPNLSQETFQKSAGMGMRLHMQTSNQITHCQTDHTRGSDGKRQINAWQTSCEAA